MSKLDRTRLNRISKLLTKEEALELANASLLTLANILERHGYKVEVVPFSDEEAIRIQDQDFERLFELVFQKDEGASIRRSHMLDGLAFVNSVEAQAIISKYSLLTRNSIGYKAFLRFLDSKMKVVNISNVHTYKGWGINPFA